MRVKSRFLMMAMIMLGSVMSYQSLQAVDILKTEPFSLNSPIPNYGWLSVKKFMPKLFHDNNKVRVMIADRPREEFMISVYRTPDDNLPGVYMISLQKSEQAVMGLLSAFSSSGFLRNEQFGVYDYYIFDRNGDGKITTKENEFPCYFDRSAGAAFCAIGKVLVTVSGPRSSPNDTYERVQKLLFDLPVETLTDLSN